MHLNRSLSARQFLGPLLAAAVMAVLSGCSTVTLTNLTPSSLSENPSEIYTFTLRATTHNSIVVDGSVAPRIVIDGRSHDMRPSSIAPDIYEFDYSLPAGRTEVAYYFLVDYKAQGNGVVNDNQVFTELTHAEILHRYVLSLEVSRGPVGARIGVLGRGFTAQDVVAFDGTPVRTVYESPTSLGFYVPGLAAGHTYAVTLSSPSGNSPIGSFRVDQTDVGVEPSSVTVAPGQRTTLTFTVPNPAPAGGLLLDITTDVPESVIMPEVVVPAGQTTASVTIEGGKPGTGSLFLKGFGSSGETTIPVTVTGGGR